MIVLVQSDPNGTFSNRVDKFRVEVIYDQVENGKNAYEIVQIRQ